MKREYKVNGINFLEKENELFVEINQCGVDALYPLKKVKTNENTVVAGVHAYRRVRVFRGSGGQQRPVLAGLGSQGDHYLRS